MSDNPYEPPQATNTPPAFPESETQFEPLPPLASEVFNEHLPFRHLAEFADKMVLTGRIAMFVWGTAIVLVGVTWLFYKPNQNPIWVTILMLNCSTVAAVLIVWRIFETKSACDLLRNKLHDPADQILILRCTGMTSGEGIVFIGCFPLAFDVLRNGDIQFLAFPIVVLIIATIAQAFSHAPLIRFLRSFVTNIVWKPGTQKLKVSRWSGALMSLIFLAVMGFQFLTGDTPWPWLMLSLTSLGLCLVPNWLAYRQLAHEYDQRWP